MKKIKIYLVLSVTSWDEQKFEIGGVFDTFEKAEKSCFCDSDVIMEQFLNERNPFETRVVGVWIPTEKIYVHPNGVTNPY